MEIRNKIAIVTGASSGIGLTTAQILTKKGAKVVLTARSKAKLEKIATSLPDSLVIQADMTKESDIKRMVKETVEHFGRVDILINNAGKGYDAPVEKIDLDIYRNIFELDVIGPIIAMKQVIPLMHKQGGGAIVNISSGTALMALPNMAAYSSIKRALVGISLTAREELKDDHIVVSVVYPYITDTDFEKNTIKHDLPEQEEGGPFPADTPQYIAQKIVEGIETEETEIYAHDWMKR